jgi:hypothetical protein
LTSIPEDSISDGREAMADHRDRKTFLPSGAFPITSPATSTLCPTFPPAKGQSLGRGREIERVALY